MKQVGGYTTDDGFRSFTNDALYFVWNEEYYELHHAVHGVSEKEYNVVTMEYAESKYQRC